MIDIDKEENVLNDKHHEKTDVSEDDLLIDHEIDPLEAEIQRLALEARDEYLERKARGVVDEPIRPKFPKWIVWLMALFLLINTLTILPQTLSIPAIQFLKTSAKLLQNDDIASYKKAITLISTNSGKGTGFAINDEGTVITNYHVIDGYKEVSVYFPENGLMTGEVVQTFPEIDLAVVQTTVTGNPHLTLAKHTYFEDDELIRFIGNPLRFFGIANEGNIIDYIQLKDWDQPVVMIKAPVYRGNSGSPIINEKGEVIGVIFATLHTEEHGKVGLFVPIDYYYEKRQE